MWFEILKKEKDACYHKVRSRYKNGLLLMLQEHWFNVEK